MSVLRKVNAFGILLSVRTKDRYQKTDSILPHLLLFLFFLFHSTQNLLPQDYLLFESLSHFYVSTWNSIHWMRGNMRTGEDEWQRRDEMWKRRERGRSWQREFKAGQRSHGALPSERRKETIFSHIPPYIVFQTTEMFWHKKSEKKIKQKKGFKQTL